MFDNKRRFIRCSYHHGSSISNDEQNWQVVKVENLSAGGLNFFLRTAEIKLGQELYLKLEVDPAGVESEKYETIAKGRIVRVVPYDEIQFEYGVEFLEKDMPSLMQIIKYIMS